MREIKFRVWDSLTKEMVPVVNLTIGLGGPVAFGSHPDKTWKDTRQVTGADKIMQYTGLKDKNGKEIYEGDILKATYPAGYSLYEVRFGEYDKEESEGSGIGWYAIEHYFIGKKSGQLITGANHFGGEVIGNIYENPDLLTSRPT